MFVSALADEAAGIVTQARRLGIDKTPIVGGNGFNSPALMKNAGAAAEGVVVGAAWNSASCEPAVSQKFIDELQGEVLERPGPVRGAGLRGRVHPGRRAEEGEHDERSQGAARRTGAGEGP